jgi:hypothetical protein
MEAASECELGDGLDCGREVEEADGGVVERGNIDGFE